MSDELRVGDFIVLTPEVLTIPGEERHGKVVGFGKKGKVCVKLKGAKNSRMVLPKYLIKSTQTRESQ